MRQSFFSRCRYSAIKYTLIKFCLNRMHYQIIHAKHDHIETMYVAPFFIKKNTYFLMSVYLHVLALCNNVFNQINFPGFLFYRSLQIFFSFQILQWQKVINLLQFASSSHNFYLLSFFSSPG